LGGVDDYYSFAIARASDVDVLIDTTSNGAFSAQLLDVNGNLISTINGGASTQRLAAGTYLIRVFASNTLDADYDVSVDAATEVAPGSNASSSAIAYDSA